VVRDGYVEVLDHSTVDLSRAADGIPLISSHDHEPFPPLGRAERVRVSGGKLRATLRFADHPRAREAWDAVQAGFAGALSIGYRVLDAVRSGTDKATGLPIYKCRFQPYEVSLVNVPADATVGIGRSLPAPKKVRTPMTEKPPRIEWVDPEVKTPSEAAAEVRTRVREILAIGERNKCEDLARYFLEIGGSLDQFREAVLARLDTRGELARAPQMPGEYHPSEPREYGAFSIFRAVEAMASGDWKHAGLERAISDDLRKRTGVSREAGSFTVPLSIFRNARRDLNVAAGTDGGYTVQTDLMAGNFIDLLRNRSAIYEAGATVIPGLVGNAAIPKQSVGCTGYWISEGSNITTESAPKFAQVTLTPKTVGAYVDWTRRMTIQGTPAVEQLMRNDLATTLVLAIDAAALKGGGSNEPSGIMSGIVSAVGTGTCGSTGGPLTWGAMVVERS
jgi:HK97 family phage major capsid protein/HK97 family phage prohead protease